MRLWIDDAREPSYSGEWLVVRSVNQAKTAIMWYEKNVSGDDSILDWLEEKGIVDTGYFFHIHSQNPVGIENMRRIIEHNNWKEVKNI